MTTDAYIRVVCDGCYDEEEIQLTATARDGYDCRNVDADIESLGWKIVGDDHYCGDCETPKNEMGGEFKLVFEPTSRGFQRADFKDRYGAAASIQESSLATEECIWLGLNEGTHHHVTGDCMARMHLNREHARVLSMALIRFANRGTLAEPTPEEAARNVELALKESEELDSVEIQQLNAELEQAQSLLKELLDALKLVTPKECPIVTHHRPDCDFCLCLRVIAKAEGKEPPEPRPNNPYYVTDKHGNRLRHG